MLASVRRLGVFGGTFDPVHNGHVVAVERFVRELRLDLALVVPSARAFYKEAARANYEDRLAMCRLAFAGRKSIEVSDIERNAGSGLYTCDLIDIVESKSPQAKLFFLIGSDAFVRVPGWYGVDRLAHRVHLVVIDRPAEAGSVHDGRTDTHACETLSAAFEKVKEIGIAVTRISGTCPMSSTTVRTALLNNDWITGMVPEAVSDYIQARRLYDTKSNFRLLKSTPSSTGLKPDAWLRSIT